MSRIAANRLIKINGHTLEVLLEGRREDPAVVLVHHGLGSLSAWKAQVGPLVGAGWRVLAYSRWGYGVSEARSGFSIPHFREDLEDLSVLLEWAGLERPVLVGHSDGGTIALLYAAQYPEAVRALIIVAAHAYVEKKMVRSIQELGENYSKNERFRQGLQRVHGEKVDWVFSGWRNGWLTPANLDWDIRPWLGNITCPSLIVQGVEDEHATPQHARAIAAKIPGAELWLVEAADHMLPQKNPGLFNQHLLAFLERLK